MSNLTNMTQELILPSRGLLNPEIPDGRVTQRCMMVSDQKYLAGSTGNNTQRLIEATITEPSTFDVSKLTPADTLFLLFSLRSLSYGKMYKFKYRCPRCNKMVDVNIDLSSLEIEELQDGFEEDLRVVLPVSGDTVYTKILKNKDFKLIEDDLQRVRKRADDTDGMRYILRLSHMITKIELVEPTSDGEKELTDPVDIRNYVTDMTDYDATAILSTVQDIRFGVIPSIEYTCPECERIIDVPLSLEPTFFRPRYDSKSRQSTK